MRRALGLLTATALSACATLDLGTALRYRNTGWEDVDPATARAAVSVPPAFRPGLAANVTVAATRPGRDEIQERFTLERAPAPSGTPLPPAAVRAEAIVFGLHPRDAARARRARAAYEAAPDREGEYAVTVTAALTFGGGDEAGFCAALDEPVRIWTRRDAADPYRPLTKRRTVRTLFGTPEACEDA